MRRKLDEIASLTKAHLAIVGQVSGNIGFGLETERNVEIVITGPYESVEQARVRLLVLLDELVRWLGLGEEGVGADERLTLRRADSIPKSARSTTSSTTSSRVGSAALCRRFRRRRGRTSTSLRRFLEFSDPRTSPSSPSRTSSSSRASSLASRGLATCSSRSRCTRFVLRSSRVGRALTFRSLRQSKCIISRDTAILPRKLDWMLTDRLEDIKQTMNDNGTFINFPAIGSQASLISVYGDHRVNIERTIRAIMQFVRPLLSRASKKRD